MNLPEYLIIYLVYIHPWSKCVHESFFYRSQLLTELLGDKQIAKLGGSWYVQNVSTFWNTFAIISPLICVFWIQLTRTHAVFSRIALVSRFCAEIWLSGKILENTAKILFCQKTHGARRSDEGGGGCGLGSPPGARPSPGRTHLWWGRLGRRLDPSFRLYIPSDLKGARVRRFSQIDFRCAAAIRNHDSKPETPFWHPTGTGIWRRSSSPSSPTSLHQPSMTPPSMCE
jgi:hypothetical protein